MYIIDYTLHLLEMPWALAVHKHSLALYIQHLLTTWAPLGYGGCTRDFCTWALPISQAWAPLVYGGCTSLGHPWELRDVRLCYNYNKFQQTAIAMTDDIQKSPCVYTKVYRAAISQIKVTAISQIKARSVSLPYY